MHRFDRGLLDHRENIFGIADLAAQSLGDDAADETHTQYDPVKLELVQSCQVGVRHRPVLQQCRPEVGAKITAYRGFIEWGIGHPVNRF